MKVLNELNKPIKIRDGVYNYGGYDIVREHGWWMIHAKRHNRRVFSTLKGAFSAIRFERSRLWGWLIYENVR